MLLALEAAGRPVSHLDLLKQMGDSHIDRVTLYRILSSLTETNFVHQVQGTDGIWRFCFHEREENQCPGCHPHFLCEKCGNMICLLETRLPFVEVPAGYQVRHKQMLMTGICSGCRESGAEEEE